MNLLKCQILFVLLAHFILSAKTMRAGLIEFNKVTCESLDPSFATIQKCLLTKREDKRMLLSTYAQLHKRIDNMTFYAKLSRLVNKKFKPFLYDDKIDFCDFIVTAKRHILWGAVYQVLVKSSNLNHTCPYEHALIVKDFVVESKFKLLPVPKGQYKMEFLLVVSDGPKIKYAVVYDKK